MDGAESGSPLIWEPRGGLYFDGYSYSGTARYRAVSTGAIRTAAFDNSRVSPVYGRSDSVVPNSRTCKFFIRYI